MHPGDVLAFPRLHLRKRGPASYPPANCEDARDCNARETSLATPRIFKRREPLHVQTFVARRPLKLSMNPFSTGRLGGMKHNATNWPWPRVPAHDRRTHCRCPPLCSRAGFLVLTRVRSSACAALIPSLERSSCKATHSRENWSTGVEEKLCLFLLVKRNSFFISSPKFSIQPWRRSKSPAGPLRKRRRRRSALTCLLATATQTQGPRDCRLWGTDRVVQFLCKK